MLVEGMTQVDMEWDMEMLGMEAADWWLEQSEVDVQQHIQLQHQQYTGYIYHAATKQVSMLIVIKYSKKRQCHILSTLAFGQ